MIIKTQMLYDERPEVDSITLEQAVIELMRFSSIENRTPELLSGLLSAGHMICTNFYIYEKGQAE